MSKKKVKEQIGKMSKVLLVKKTSKNAELPEYMLESDVGLDLKANEDVVLKPMEQKAVKTGIILKIPNGCVGLIRDRAGIVSEMNVHTSAGTIDPAYRGEISVMLINFNDETIEIEKGMRIAQLVIMPVVKVKIEEAEKLPITERYDKGFGSTGLKEKIKDFEEIEKEVGEEEL